MTDPATLHLVTQSDCCDAWTVAVLGLRDRKKEKTRDALVESALRQFAERGFERVTVDDIASDCELSPRTFFRYFASKEDVLFAGSDDHVSHVIARLAAQPSDVPVLVALRVAVREIADRYQGEARAVQQRHKIFAATPSLRGRVAERHHRWESAAIAELRRSGRAATMDELTMRLTVATVTTVFRVATEVWIDGRCRGDLGEYFDAAFEQVRAGLRN